MKLVAIIPAHLASIRFPEKILHSFYGLPMVEHVRRRALLTNCVSDVYVATCDKEIADTIHKYGGNVIMTSDSHSNGTSRVAEAVCNIDCTHVLLLQGDEPLLLPGHINAIADEIQLNEDIVAFNATGPLQDQSELDRHSFVKCAISSITNNILYCFRRSPCFSNFEIQKQFVRKILGIIAYKKDFLIDLEKLKPTSVEQAELIEQMKIIEYGFKIRSISVSPSLPSVNEPAEAELILRYIDNHVDQQEILNKILN